MKQFKDIPIGEVFLLGNTRWRKVSSRTARDVDYSGKVYYFKLTEYSDRVRTPIPTY